jgi:phosphatidylethanolamine/phosphatidyl-N-methylethanolamine N-methyltransferase
MSRSPRSPSFVSRRYDRVAPFYGLLSRIFLLRSGIRRAAVEALRLKPGDAVLEIGCGTGANLELLAAAVGQSGRVIGLDLSPQMLSRAEALRRERGWQNVDLSRRDAAALDVARGSVDGVLFSLSYTVLPDREGTLAAAWGALAPGGRLVVMDAAAPEGAIGRLLAPLMRVLGAVTVLGDPLARPWDDLAALGAEVEVRRFQAGTYFVCAATKPRDSGSGAGPGVAVASK